jgi:NAD(P)-dependent dehydrogenase (short-subunit alcohol dehydrogenase family)
MGQTGVGGLRLSLEGKVALVTGGSRGIGAATVRLFRQAGAKVVFSFRSRSAEADALVAETGGEGFCRALQQELATVDDGGALVTRAARVFGRVDILVVNHGIWPPHDQPIATMGTEQWRDTMGINLDSVFGLVRAATRQMLGAQASAAKAAGNVFAGADDPTALAGAREYGPGEAAPETEAEGAVDARELLEEAVFSDKITWPDPSSSGGSLPAAATADASSAFAQAGQGVRGHIILVASTAAQRGEAFHADYAASKGALLSLTKSLSSELGPQGILCNCVAPGWVRTEMSAGTLGDPEASKKALSFIPLRRAAEPEEIAGPIVFLCTPWAGFISGEIWNVNGGAVLVG